MLFNYLFYPKRFQLNISRPNVYIFEYETQVSNQISLYNLLNTLTYILSLFLLYLSFEKFSGRHHQIDLMEYKRLVSGIIFYFIGKNFLTYLIYYFNKQDKKYHKLRFINSVFNTYLGFQLYILSFLFFFFPYNKAYLLLIITIISSLFILSVWFKIFINYSKHFYMKSYKLFLYLCLTEILPLIMLIGWISFHIL